MSAVAGVKRPWLWTGFAVTLLAIPVAATLAAHAQHRPLPRYGQVPAFTLTDQTGQPFSSRDLDGKAWVADFVFTSCSLICPRLTERMAELQRYVQNRGADGQVRLVSITVDPERDTVERLRAYAAGFQANPSLWKFATGPIQAVEDAVVHGFKIGIDKEKDDSTDGFAIVHGTRFVLVDGRGTIRGYYDANDAPAMAKLRDDLATLVAGGGT